MDDPRVEVLGAELRQTLGDQVIPSTAGDRWLLLGESAGRTVEVEYGGGVVRLYAGRIVHALSAEDTEEIRHVAEVALAIKRGRAAELFGRDAQGRTGAIGHEISGEGFTYRALDDDAEVLARVPI
jgi:hypothetical protein